MDPLISHGHNHCHDFFIIYNNLVCQPGDTVACGMLPKPRYVWNIMGLGGLIDYRLVDVDNVAEVLALVGGRVDRLKTFSSVQLTKQCQRKRDEPR